jgi:hypothetical protein
VVRHSAVQRLLRHLDKWNVTNNKDYEMSVTWVLNAYVPGESVRDTLDRVSRKMQSVQQGRSAPVYLALPRVSECLPAGELTAG